MYALGDKNGAIFASRNYTAFRLHRQIRLGLYGSRANLMVTRGLNRRVGLRNQIKLLARQGQELRSDLVRPPDIQAK